jgi:hypothetical protein
MRSTSVIEAHESFEVPAKVSGQNGVGRVDNFPVPDPSIYFLVDPPQRRRRFRSWFALAFFGGILIALAIVAILSS